MSIDEELSRKTIWVYSNFDVEKPLYSGCINCTKLSALIKLYNLKTCFKWSDKSFLELLEMLGNMLPINNELPLSMYEAKKTLKTL